MYEKSKPPKKGGSKKKGAAESVKQEKKDLNKMPGDVKQMDTPPARKKGGAKKDMMMDEKPVARKKGAAQYKEEGAADFKGGLHAKNTKHSESGEHLGAKRMGFTQNFGAARQNSYAQGAAKVASIMSFGASKKKGAADSGHGEPDGHDHPTKTIKSREVSGGGSDSSSSSVSNSNIPKATGGKQTKDISGYMTALNKRFPNTSGADLASKTYISSDMVDNYDSNFRSNSSSSSNPRGVSESSQTTVSPMSMSETLKSGQLQAENRKETNQFNKAITNITATNDSITTANNYIKSQPAFNQNNPKVLKTASIRGGISAFQTRSASGDYSRRKAYSMFKAGKN